MKHNKIEKAEIFEGKTNITFEYNLPDKDINWCVIDVNGRFPTEGWAKNNICKGLYFVIEGDGKLFIEGKTEIYFTKNDIILVEPGEKFYWDAKCKFGLSCTPAWYPEQHERIGD